MEFLELPVLGDELARQPVEQVRVRGALAVEAKVVRRADDAAAEMVVPDAVNQHAGGQRILGAGDPLGQLQTAFAFGSVGRQTQLG